MMSNDWSWSARFKNVKEKEKVERKRKKEGKYKEKYPAGPRVNGGEIWSGEKVFLG